MFLEVFNTGPGRRMNKVNPGKRGGALIVPNRTLAGLPVKGGGDPVREDPPDRFGPRSRGP